MKKIVFVLITAIVLAGCGNRSPSLNILDPDFFSEKIQGEITISAYDTIFYKSFLEGPPDYLKPNIPVQK